MNEIKGGDTEFNGELKLDEHLTLAPTGSHILTICQKHNAPPGLGSECVGCQIEFLTEKLAKTRQDDTQAFFELKRLLFTAYDGPNAHVGWRALGERIIEVIEERDLLHTELVTVITVLEQYTGILRQQGVIEHAKGVLARASVRDGGCL